MNIYYLRQHNYNVKADHLQLRVFSKSQHSNPVIQYHELEKCFKEGRLLQTSQISQEEELPLVTK